MSFTPGGQETRITTATTATVVSAPAASTQRLVKNIRLTNASSVAIDLTVQHDKAATATEIARDAALAAGASIDVEGPFVLDATDETITVTIGTAQPLHVVAAYADRS